MAHGLLTGAVDESTTFAAGDWRADSPDFHGEAFRRNVEAIRELREFARDALGCSVAQLAIAWVLANPAVDVALVGARHPRHIADSVAAADLELSEGHLREIDRIVAGSTPVIGPSPESNRVAAER
jgi:aryl-alcohol dehydrogenase-like predicted oxidoreductase